MEKKESMFHTARLSRAPHWPYFGFSLAFIITASAALLFLVGCQKAVDPVAGTWQAEIFLEDSPNVAFQLEVVRDGDQVKGALVNGSDREESTSGSFDGKTLVLKFNFYDAVLRADLNDGKLAGEFSRQRGKITLVRKLVATRELPQYKDSAAGPDLSGDWILKVGEGDDLRVWSATLNQKGEHLTGTVIPISGDWGSLNGYARNGEIYLSRFDGINASVWTAKLDDNGRLVGSFPGNRKVVAERFEQAISQGVKPVDPDTYTTVKNPEEPFRFEGVDLDGKPVKSTDSRFKDKVVLVTITGTWCPNCHEEAPVLVDLYSKYKSQGLEIVALAYEYTGNRDRDLAQLKIYRQRHGIEFPLLLAGTTEPGEIQRTLPQLDNFGAYPTTIYVGRDGKVDYIHAGFEGKATGERHKNLVAEIERRVKEMLEEGKS